VPGGPRSGPRLRMGPSGEQVGGGAWPVVVALVPSDRGGGGGGGLVSGAAFERHLPVRSRRPAGPNSPPPRGPFGRRADARVDRGVAGPGGPRLRVIRQTGAATDLIGHAGRDGSGDSPCDSPLGPAPPAVAEGAIGMALHLVKGGSPGLTALGPVRGALGGSAPAVSVGRPRNGANWAFDRASGRIGRPETGGPWGQRRRDGGPGLTSPVSRKTARRTTPAWSNGAPRATSPRAATSSPCHSGLNEQTRPPSRRRLPGPGQAGAAVLGQTAARSSWSGLVDHRPPFWRALADGTLSGVGRKFSDPGGRPGNPTPCTGHPGVVLNPHLMG